MPGAKFRAVYVPRFATRSCSSSQKSGRQQTDEYLIEFPSEQKKLGSLDLSTKKVKLTKHTKPMITMKKVKEADISKPNKSPILEVKRKNQRLIHGGTSQSKLNQSNSRMSGNVNLPLRRSLSRNVSRLQQDYGTSAYTLISRSSYCRPS